MNRAERRAQAHGRNKGDDIQDNLLPQSVNNPGAATEGADEEPGTVKKGMAGDKDMANPGTGGAVESDGRLPHHEGMHLPNVPNA